jgi:hypothetical protein
MKDRIFKIDMIYMSSCPTMLILSKMTSRAKLAIKVISEGYPKVTSKIPLARSGDQN